MAIGYHRESVARIDCRKIYENIQAEQAHLPADTFFFAVIKADAYGHGSLKVAEIARAAGVDGFCVAVLDEALELRKAGFTEPILILGHVAARYAPLMAEQNLSVAVSSVTWLEEAAQIAQQQLFPAPLKVHIKLDTGMGRIGFWQETEMQKANDYLVQRRDLFELEGLFTHFATADQKDESYFKKQQMRWQNFRKLFPEDIRYVHTANSATALWHKAWGSNLVRYGISIYGLNPSGTALPLPFAIMPALDLLTEIIEVKQVPAGESIGYGASYTTTKTEWIATLPLGYADGLRRQFSGFEVLVAGQRAPIVGRICMDQCMLRLPAYFPVGTPVVVYSSDPEAVNSVQKAAEYVGTISYELCCEISARVPRVYVNQDF